MTGWKEIARFLGVSVKTAQIKERDESLPVRRASSGERPRVWAYRTDIDRWLETHQSRKRFLGIGPKVLIFLCTGLVFVVVGAAFWLTQWSGVCKPASYEVTGNRLQVFDSSGRLCWQKVFDPQIVASHYQPGAARGILHPPVVVTDLQQDGTVEILFNLVSTTSKGSSLICFNEDGSKRWEVRY